MALFHASQCRICPRHCDLKRGSAACGAYLWTSHGIENLAWGAVSEWAIERIEKKPLYHFRPGTRVLSLGSWGCTLRCRYCLNGDLAWRAQPPGGLEAWTPERVVETALSGCCEGLAWTYNEAAVWLPFVIETNRLAKARGLYTVLVTNGVYTPEALAELLPTLDAWRVDLKGFSDELYQDLLGVPFPARIARETTELAKGAGVHVEVVTCMVPGWHDLWDDLAPLAGWIASTLGPATPWHLLRFHPQHAMRDVPPFPREAAEAHALRARACGLMNVYVGGNGMPGAESSPAERHYDWWGPDGSFLRLTIDHQTGRVGYVGDEALLAQVIERCRGLGLSLSVATLSRCG